MKKKYMFVFSLFTAFAGIAQQKVVEKKPAYEGLSVDVLSVKPKKTIQPKAEGDVFYEEHFSGSNGTWTTSGPDGAVWQFDTDGPDGQYSSTTNADIITSATAGDGFMIFDADLSNPAQPFVNREGSLVSPVIDMTGRTSVSIRFQQAYRTCCSASFFPKLELSTDGFATFQTYDVTELGIGVNDFSGTVTKEININDFLATATNLANFQFRFNFDGNAGASSHYFWQVDDIELFEPYSYSLKAILSYWGTLGFWGARLPYSMVPVSQIAPVDFSLIVENKGSVTQNDVQFSTSIPEASFNDAGALGTIPAFSADTLNALSSFTPGTSPLVYNPSFVVSSGATDIDVSDNDITGLPIEVTNNVYARDMQTVDGGTFNQGEGYEVGNIFDMFADAVTSGATVMPRSTSNVGAQIYARLYDLDPVTRDFRFVTESSLYTLTQADLGQLVTLNFPENVDLLADSSYLMVVGTFGDGGATNDLVTATAGSSEPQTTYYFDMTDQTWYYTTGTPIVRMNLVTNASVSDLGGLETMSVYPNPAKEMTQLTFALNQAEKVTIHVIDVAGKVIATQTVDAKSGNNHVELSTATFANGIYTVKIATVTAQNTVKLMVK